MAILLSAAQAKEVATKRRKPDNRPKYYNAEFKQSMIISEDFEAFLILMGRGRAREALDWLQKVSSLGIDDADRDALVAQAIDADKSDAIHKYIELRPIIRQFGYFRDRFSMTGFENVAEAGLLLADMQRAMGEITTTGNRWNHQKLWDDYNLDLLSKHGLTMDQNHQLNSWVNTLTAY
jgi:hypothetical protein